MGGGNIKIDDELILERDGIQRLLDALNGAGSETVGPTIHNNAIVYDKIQYISDLPVGWNDEQGPGKYRLEKSDDDSLFEYVVGPHSWKKYLHPPLVRLWRAERGDDGFHVVEAEDDAPRYAFVAVRACEISAIAVHDRVFTTEQCVDPLYTSIREKIFIVAVNCTRPGGTCFCVSMNTGPKAKFGFDVALTEVLDGGRHYFVAEVGSKKGAEVLAEIPHRMAEEHERNTARGLIEQASNRMGRTMDTKNLSALFYEKFDHPRWNAVAARCLTCGNCTMVCPTCFCTNIEDVNSLNGGYAERWRKWDSCFTVDFSYMHGGSIRTSEKSRYRQWLTHKLSTWMEQFGTLGCVGCGRCITWCPVGIDLTEEKKAILEEAGAVHE